MYWAQFLTVALVHLVAVASPGPDFAMVIRQSVQNGRRQGLLCALGIATGIALHMSYCLLGVGILLTQSPWFLTALKLLAASYLCYVGVKALGVKSASGVAPAPTFAGRSAFWAGFLTNGLNPKATLFFVSLFSLVIDAATPLQMQLLYASYLIIATGLWFALMASVFSHARVRHGFLRMGHWFDRLMGAILLVLGIKVGLDEIYINLLVN